MEYCIIWGATYVSNLRRKLINLQKRVVRIISNAKYRDSADSLYKSLGILKLVDINKYLIAHFMFRHGNNKVPELFNSYFEYKSDYHNYNTQSAQHFHAPKVKTDLAKTALKYHGAVIWNAVVNHGIYSDTSETIFIKFLKLVVDILPQKCTKFLYMYILSLSSFWLPFFCYLYIMPNIRIPHMMSVFSLNLLLDALMSLSRSVGVLLSTTLTAPVSHWSAILKQSWGSWPILSFSPPLLCNLIVDWIFRVSTRIKCVSS